MRILAGGRVFLGQRQSPELDCSQELYPSTSRFCFACLMELSGADRFKPN